MSISYTSRCAAGKRRLGALFSIFLILLVCVAPGASAQPTGEPVSIAVSVCPPFVMEENGEFTGLSIFLLDEMALELDFEYVATAYTLKEMLEKVASGEVRAGATCLSITRDREESMDFTHSYYETHTAIAIRKRGYLDAIESLFSNTRILSGLGIIAAAAAAIGLFFYLLEHKINPRLYSLESRTGKVMEAFIVGLLFVTRGPIRFYEFKTSAARVVAAILAIGSTFLIAGITALLASAFTVEHFRSQIDNLQDLAQARVAALEASQSSQFLHNQGISHQTFSELPGMIAALDRGDLDAVVSDAAFLKYAIRAGKAEGRYESLAVLPYEYERQNYGFAVGENSRYVEEINLALLTIRKSREWKDEVARYFGD